MSDASHSEWDATLEAHGLEAVRHLLEASSSKGAGSIVYGFGDTISEMPTRAYVEKWRDRHDAEERLRRERLATLKHWWTRGIPIATLLAAVASAVFTVLHPTK